MLWGGSESCGDALNEGHDLIHLPSPEEGYALPSSSDEKLWGIQSLDDEPLRMYNFTAEQRLNAINISRTLAMAYVMDQVSYNFLSLLLLPNKGSIQQQFWRQYLVF